MNKEVIIKAEEAHKRRERIIKLKKVGAFSWLNLGKELYDVEKNDDWDKLGFDSMRSYMAAPETSGGLDLTRTWMLAFKCNYEKYIKQLGQSTDQIAMLSPAKLNEVRGIINEENAEEWLEKIKTLSLSDIKKEIEEAFPPDPVILPEGKYSIIYMDPPWDYGNPQHGGDEVEDTGGAHTHYRVMKDEEIGKIDMAKISADDCLVFMWVGAPKMRVAIEIGIGWGFNYATVGFVWYKENPNPGAYTMSECEFCLIFKKGQIPKPRGDRNIRQFLSEKRTDHSKKPNEIRRRIELMFPTQKKLEMFARQKTKGWDIMGNETDKYDTTGNR